MVPPGFIPPGLAKKCGQTDEEYPDMHPGGPRDGWEKQYKKKHWELTYTNDVSLALPEPLQVTEADSTKWKQSYVYGAGGERLSMTYLPAYDDNNGWEPTPGDGGAEPGTQPKTLWYMQDGLGSTIGLAEKDGRVSARYHYDEFGVMLDSKKMDLNWPGPDSLFGYTGLGYDYTSSLTYARARYYQPELGRFISEDTYEGDIANPLSQNRYDYVENNPLINVDPSGHSSAKTRTYLFALRHPKIAKKIGEVEPGVRSTNISTVAVRFATNDLGLWENTSHEGSQVNAFRHALWQAMITTEFGKNIAKEVGNAHEENPDVDLSSRKFDSLSVADQSIDLLNNKAGRAIGSYFSSGASRKSIALATLDYYHEIGLYVVQKQYDGTYMSYNIVLEKLSDEQYEVAKNRINELDDNGFAEDQ